jgi:hypothetical protein
MYAEYLKETYGLHTFENKIGFITYKVDFGDLHIEDVYIKPDARNGEGRKEIIRELVKTLPLDFIDGITVAIDPEQEKAEEMLTYLLTNGFKLGHMHSLMRRGETTLLHMKKDDFIKRLG